MVNLKTETVKIAGRFFNKDKSGYPIMPTVFSGVEVNWGAGSCIEHPEPSRATLSLWVPKTHEAWVPKLGDEVIIEAGDTFDMYNTKKTVFAGKVEGVKLQDDKKPVPAPYIPNSTNITALTGWALRYNFAGPGSARTDMSSTVTIQNNHTFAMPFQSVGENIDTHWFFTKTPKFDVTALKQHSINWETNYPASMSIELRYYNAAGTQVGGTTTNNNISTRTFIFTPPPTAVKADVEVYAAFNQNYAAVNGLYTIGQFILGVEGSAGFHVNITAADALAEAARLRLSSTPFPFEPVLNRQNRIADIATAAGVKFYGGLTEAQGYSEALGTDVRARDIDSYPALELFQRTTMAAGHTVLSAKNVVQPSYTLDLPQVLLGSQPASGVVYGWDATGFGRHTMTTNGVLTRTNFAAQGSAEYTASYFFVNAGTGGVVDSGRYGYDTKIGTTRFNAKWTTGASGGVGTMGVSYKQGGITGASASKVSAGLWVRCNVDRTVKLAVTLFNAGAAAGTVLGAGILLKANVWTWLNVDNVTATAAYDTVEVNVLPQFVMASNQAIDIDGVLIEKAATSGPYFDQYSLDAAADVVASERLGIMHIDASAIVDDVFERDTSNVVNEIKVELIRFIGTVGDPGWEQKDAANESFDQIFTNEAGSRKTTPQQRSIATDWAIRDAYLDANLPTSVMVLKGNLLLAGQSTPQWRMSSAMKLVLSEVDSQVEISSLLDELTRFGALIKITNGPTFVAQYMRVRGGRIVLGDNPALEFDLEPVEYSAPIPLNYNTLRSDDVASHYQIGNFKTLTSQDLRQIGAR